MREQPEEALRVAGETGDKVKIKSFPDNAEWVKRLIRELFSLAHASGKGGEGENGAC